MSIERNNTFAGFRADECSASGYEIRSCKIESPVDEEELLLCAQRGIHFRHIVVTLER